MSDYPAPKFPLSADREHMLIFVGDKGFSSPDLWLRPENDFSVKEMVTNAEPDWACTLAEKHKRFAELVGPRFNRRFFAANYWLWLGDRFSPKVANLLRAGGYRGWRRYSDRLVERANLVRDRILQAEADGLLNLVPAIVVFQASPHDIRKRVGQGAWRRIANNSTTRNKKMMQFALRANSVEGWDERFLSVMEFPSGVIDAAHTGDEDEGIAARICPLKNPRSFQWAKHLVADTRRMAGAINPNWSLQRFQREHEAATLAVRRGEFSDKPFTKPWSFDRGGYSATLLTTPLEIALEGDHMHHCVGSYASAAKSGRYAVLKLDGKERATAGLTPSGRQWRVEQVYGACNSDVSDACLDFAIAVAIAYERRAA